MAEAIGSSLPLAVGVALSPIPIIGVVIMLATPRARVNGPAFLGGWIVGIALVGVIVLLVSGGADATSGGEPAGWTGILKLLLGLCLLLVAWKQWRGRPRGDAEPEMPAWMKSIDSFRPGRAAGLAFLLSAINPKNLILVVGAATAIAQTGIEAGQQAVSLLVFTLVATLGPGLPVLIYFTMGDRSRQILEDLKASMSRHNAVIMAVICLVIAAKLIGDGIGNLSV